MLPLSEPNLRQSRRLLTDETGQWAHGMRSLGPAFTYAVAAMNLRMRLMIRSRRLSFTHATPLPLCGPVGCRE